MLLVVGTKLSVDKRLVVGWRWLLVVLGWSVFTSPCAGEAFGPYPSGASFSLSLLVGLGWQLGRLVCGWVMVGVRWQAGNGYLVEQVREVGVSLDGMVGREFVCCLLWVVFSWLEGGRR